MVCSMYDKIDQCCVEILDPRLEDNVLGFLNSLEFVKEKFFAGINFRKLVRDHENREHFCLMKIYRLHSINYNKCTDHHLLGFLGLLTWIQ